MIPKQGNKNHDQREEKYLAEFVHGSRGTAVCHRGYDSSTGEEQGTIPTWLHIIQLKKTSTVALYPNGKKRSKKTVYIYKMIIKKQVFSNVN